MNLRVMTYNIQHGHVHTKDFIDLTRTCDVIKQYNPDIIGLNEVRGNGPDADHTAQAETMAAYLGYHCYFGRSVYFHGVGAYGNAVLSRFPIVEASVIRIPQQIEFLCSDALEPRTICRCVVEFPENGHMRQIAVYSTHFGLTAPEHDHAASTAFTTLRGEKLPFVLMGDFNMTPDNPNLVPLNAEFSSADKYIDGKLTFPSDNPRIKIDYIYSSKDIKITAADVPQVIASDHFPVWADITF